VNACIGHDANELFRVQTQSLWCLMGLEPFKVVVKLLCSHWEGTGLLCALIGRRAKLWLSCLALGGGELWYSCLTAHSPDHVVRVRLVVALCVWGGGGKVEPARLTALHCQLKAHCYAAWF
jgi:hypothetical protein